LFSFDRRSSKLFSEGERNRRMRDQSTARHNTVTGKYSDSKMDWSRDSSVDAVQKRSRNIAVRVSFPFSVCGGVVLSETFYSFWSFTLVDTIKIISITSPNVICIYAFICFG
jgi:hypothetical protein